MGLKKGQTNNPAGRPKGTPNKVSASTKEWIQQLIDGNRQQLEDDLKSLDPKERWQTLERLMPYIVPKMQSVDANLNLSTLTDEQLDTVVNELLNRIENENRD